MSNRGIYLALIFFAVDIFYSSGVAARALVGIQLGINHLPASDLRIALGVVLLIAAGGLLFT